MKTSHTVIVYSVGYLFLALLISFLPNDSGFVFFKVALIGVLAWGAWYFSQLFTITDEVEEDSPEEDQHSPPEPNLPADNLNIKTDQNIEDNFQYFLDAVMPLMKQILVGNTVVLLLVNARKKQFFVRARLSDLQDQLSNEKYFDINIGLPSLVFKHRKTLLENHLPESENLLPYYREGMPAKSFIGVPLLFDGKPVGVVCLDSNVEASFSEEDKSILILFSKLLALHLESSNKLYEFETENWTTRLLYDFSKDTLALQSRRELWQYLSDSVRPVFAAARVVICERIDAENSRVSYVDGEAGDLPEGSTFANKEGIMGWVIRKNQSLMVEDFSSKDNYIPRFRLEETPNRELLSLLAVPVSRGDQVVAVLAVEGRKKAQFGEQHKRLLETMANQIAAWLEKTDVIDQLHSQNMLQPSSGLPNMRALSAEIRREISRSAKNQELFCLQGIDFAPRQSQSDAELSGKLVKEIAGFASIKVEAPASLYHVAENRLVVLWPQHKGGATNSKAGELQLALTNRRPWVNGLVEQVNFTSVQIEYPLDGSNAGELIDNLQEHLRHPPHKGSHLAPEQHHDAGDDDA